jgi:hypothetical protein
MHKQDMRNPLNRLYVVFIAFLVNIFMVPYVGMNANHLVGYSIFSLCVVLLPLYILFSKDALEHIANVSRISSAHKTVAWLIACLPTITFGLLAIGIGAGLILWVLYNLLIERQPEFTGAMFFGGFGLGPIMLIFGLYCLKSLWVKCKNA